MQLWIQNVIIIIIIIINVICFRSNLQKLFCIIYCLIYTTTTTVLRLRPFVRDYQRVSRYQKKHSPIHHPNHHPVFISFFHLLRSIASSLFKLRAWQSFCTTSVHVLLGLPLGIEPSASYSIHTFTQPMSSFRDTCLYHRVFCCSIKIISSIPSLSTPCLWNFFTLTFTHPSDLLYLLKRHLILFPDRPRLTSVCHTTLHTTAIQPPSPNQ